MKILPTVLAMILLSLFLAAANQYFPGSSVPTIIYALTTVALVIVDNCLQKRSRAELVARLNALFDGGEADLTAEDEDSALARRVTLARKSAAVREARLRDGYEHLSALVSDIAHQSKTPLTSVRMYAEMLDNPEGEAIRSQTDRLTFLFDALVRLSRCECGLIGGNLRPDKNPVEELVCRAVSDALLSAEKKEIIFRADIEKELYAVFDLRWTAEALFNICDNAVKYSPKGSEVTLTARDFVTSVRIDVADRGPGIPENEKNEVWKRFYRGAGSAQAAGVGIGLTLTRAIVTAQGGQTLCADNPGGGTVFSVFLPKSVNVREMKDSVTVRKD